jgi:hypothetical protein
MRKPSRRTLPKAVQDSKEEEFCDDDSAIIKPSPLRPTKYDYILSVIEDYLVLEVTNFGMPPIAEYHVVSDSLGIVHVEKIPISFALDRF